MGKTKIEWATDTWNPIRARLVNRDAAIRKPVGAIGWHCTHASEGCRFCYAESMNRRLGTGLDYKPGHEKDVEIFLDEKMLLAPLRWKRPRKIFVGSMTDLFADFVKDEWLDRIFAVMALCQQHTFQLLTKRPERMRAYMAHPDHAVRWFSIIDDEWARAHEPLSLRMVTPNAYLENVWLGTSCEDQATADERIPHLLATPATVRFFSLEPLLGPVDIRKRLIGHEHHGIDMARPVGERVGATIGWTPPVDFVIVGGESGPGARPNWTPNVRSIVHQCQKAGVAVFVKQMGSNVRDRNDAGFDGESPQDWYIDYGNVEHEPDGFVDEAQGAPVRVHLKDRKGGNPEEWPEDLRVREFPKAA